MFANLKLRQRILLGYLAPLLLLVAIMALVFANLQDAESATRRLEQYRQIEDGAYEVTLDVAIMQRTARGYLLKKNPLSRTTYEQYEKAFRDKESLTRLVQEPQQAETLRRLLEVGAELHDLTRQQIDLVDEGKPDEAIAQFRTGTTLKKAHELEDLTNRFLQQATEQRQEQQATQHNALAAVRHAIVYGGAAVLIIAAGIAWWLATGLSHKISAYAVQLASTASEIAATVTEHERTASQQAAAANQTSATIEELSASSRQSAEQAANAATLAGDATRNTEEGSTTARRSIAAMAGLKDKINLMADQILRLSEQSGQIGSIAGLVKDLASEINMLALNAAVEATRAGEHGKGFAVVASEVRKLADQSKKSAEQTAGLIAEIQKATNSSIMMTEDSSHMVADVAAQAQQVGALFEQLSNMVARVNMNAQQVMLNAKQQAVAFSQVVEATTSISAGTRETAAGIGQTKIAVEQLNQAAQNLKAMA